MGKDELHFGRFCVHISGLDEIYIYESLICESPYIKIFKFAVS